MVKESFVKELAAIVGSKNVLSARRDLMAYSYDATSRQEMPDVVVFPNSTAEVSAIARAAHREGIPVIPRGAGTGLSGGTLAIKGGVILELSRMNGVLIVDTANRRTVVEPGVINLDLQNTLAPLGFMYPPDPASQKVSTLGGNIGENAGGPHCLRYGVTSKYVCGMEVVLSSGEVVEIGSSVEDIPGYDLRGLLVGSEGTLGIVTKLILHIIPKPEASRTLLAIFDALEDASQAVSDIISAGILPGALELLDKTSCQVIEQSVQAGYPMDAEGVLMIELEGLADSLDKQVKDISVICQRNKVRELRFARNSAEQAALWKGRRGAFGAIAKMSPQYIVHDGTVPRTNLVLALRKVREIAQKYNLTIANVAHAGDGNLHPLIMFDSSDPIQRDAAKDAGQEILDTCLSLGGTITGEHGIGLEKLDAMYSMFSPAELATMRKVKSVFDPNDILNPGKLLPGPDHIGADKPLPMVVDRATTTRKAVSQDLFRRLAEVVCPERVMIDSEITGRYEVDGLTPTAVVFASNTEQVSQIVKAGNKFGVPIIPWGGGSKQGIGPCLSATGIVLCLESMKQIIDLDASNLTAQVEAGIVNGELQRQLIGHRLFFPLDPPFAETSTIGGQLAANASGPRRLMYGTARDLVLGVTVVTPTGDIIRAGGKTMKNVAGFDLCKMFIGSCGTLGIITEAVLRLYPLPESSRTLCIFFSSFEDAFRLVSKVLNSPLLPSSMELIDRVAGRYMERTVDLPWKEKEVLLMINVEGDHEAVERHLKEIGPLAEMNKACRPDGIGIILEGEEASRTWNAYSGIHRSMLSADPSTVQGKASVPLSKLGDMFRAAKQVGDRFAGEIGVTAHCGSGILYPYISTANADVVHIVGDLRQAAAGLGGHFIVEAAPLQVRKSIDIWPHRNDYTLMKRLKTQLDPNNVLNPGRVVGGLC